MICKDGDDIDFDRWYRELYRKYHTVLDVCNERNDALVGTLWEKRGYAFEREKVDDLLNKPLDKRCYMDSRFSLLNDLFNKMKRMLETVRAGRPETHHMADVICLDMEFDKCSNLVNGVFLDYVLNGGRRK